MPHKFTILLLLRSNLTIDLLLTFLPLLNQLLNIFSEDPDIVHLVENLVPDIKPLLKLLFAHLGSLANKKLFILF